MKSRAATEKRRLRMRNGCPDNRVRASSGQLKPSFQRYEKTGFDPLIDLINRGMLMPMNRLLPFRAAGLAFLIPFLLAAAGCGSPHEDRDSAKAKEWEQTGEVLPVERLPGLPMPVSNNAVATVPSPNGPVLFSFMGLQQGKTHADTTLAAFRLEPGADAWHQLVDVPGQEGRLAGIAATVGGQIYIFGGYTVAADHSEHSVASVHRLDLADNTYTEVAPKPVPVDDTVALAYRDRYVYLVSGWHETGNVNLVQLYDTNTDTWRQATPWPGKPVFGHAGGIVGDTMVIADGVGVEVGLTGRQFTASADAYKGVIDQDDPTRIEWRALPPHPGKPLYRMAATGTSRGGARILFAGGSDNPYNYDGIGYDGNPSEPSQLVFCYDLENDGWQIVGRLPFGTMDHRGLMETETGWVIAGGMRAGQEVTDEVIRFRIPDRTPR